jgi:hypothetical protein
MNFGFTPIAELHEQGKKAIAYCKKKGYTIKDFNIIYFEGLNTDLVTKNNDALDEWNDVRAVITSDGQVLMACSATCEPGRFYTDNPLNSNGAARLALGEHKDAWCFGYHHDQWALVQCGNVKIYRDKNQDGFRTGDAVFVGSSYGINQHTTKNPTTLIGKWSAGCCVGKFPETHKEFMRMCKASGLGLFSAILIDGSDFILG